MDNAVTKSIMAHFLAIGGGGVLREETVFAACIQTLPLYRLHIQRIMQDTIEQTFHYREYFNTVLAP